MKAAVVGTGRMGKAIAWAMDKLGCTELTLIDSTVENLEECAKGVSCPTTSFQAGNPSSLYKAVGLPYELCPSLPIVPIPFLGRSVSLESVLKNNNIVISALPYHQNEKLARHCIDHDVPYCDLGGHVGTSHNINEYAKEKGSLVMTDLGLAPGWVNILAEHGYNSHNDLPETVEMMVGGLPITPNNYLKYNCNWSHDGLINEYKDQCTVLTDGSIALADGMSGLINVETSLGVMEAFYTSGGASHTIETMQKRGIQNCHYRTIRYKGHCEVMKFLMCNISSDDELVSFLDKACPPAPDLVIVKVKVGGYKRIADWKEEKIVYSNDKFSAMQMATAFPISVAAYLIGNGNLNGPLAYKDIPYEEFETKLEHLFEEAG